MQIQKRLIDCKYNQILKETEELLKKKDPKDDYGIVVDPHVPGFYIQQIPVNAFGETTQEIVKGSDDSLRQLLEQRALLKKTKKG